LNYLASSRSPSFDAPELSATLQIHLPCSALVLPIITKLVAAIATEEGSFCSDAVRRLASRHAEASWRSSVR